MRFCCVVFLILGVLFQAAPQETDGPADGDQAGGLLEAREVPAEASGAEAPSPGDGAGDASHESQDSGEGWYMGKPIRDIVFEGLNHLDPSELEGITRPYLEKLFSDSLYTEILGKLYALDYFDTITPTAVRSGLAGNEVILRFAVKEKPVVSKINFTGAQGLRRNELLDIISLKTNDVVTPLKLASDAAALRNKYLEKGYPDIDVTYGTKDGPKGTVVVTFEITEGEKITIEAFVFEGNTVFTDKTLQRQLSLSVKSIGKDGAFQEAKLLADRDTLAQYYRDRGYIEAAVLDVMREVRKDEKGGNRMTITFRISEGRRYTFGGVFFEGNEIFPDEQLGKLVYSKTGEVANDQRIQADLARVADLYYENGYIFNKIEPVQDLNRADGTVSYRIQIVERGRAHIEHVIVRGNEKTKDSVILREIPLEPGDVFSKTKVLDGMRNLYNLQFFSQVFPDTPEGSAENLMDLVFNVEEQPTTDIQMGMTFSGSADPDTFPVSLLLRWNDRNFRGTGNVLGAEINASDTSQSLTLDYTHRWLFGLPLSGSFDFTVQHMNRKGFSDQGGGGLLGPMFNGDEDYAYPDGFYSYADFYNDSTDVSSEFLMPYNQWKLSLGMSTGYRFSTLLGNLSLAGGLRLGMIHTQYDADLFRPFDPVLRNEHNRWTPQTSIWTSLSLDQRDKYYDPSTGYYAIQRLGYYGLFDPEEEHYIRSDTKAEVFFTLFRIPVSETFAFKGVFGLHSGLSFLLAQPTWDSPVVEKANQLAVDGMFIGRGWSSEYSNKGMALFENWAEIRIPLAADILAWDFFLDAAGVKKTPGKLFDHFYEADSSGSFFMRFSYGGGIRFTIPQFPFRFSLAKRFKIKDGQVEWEQGAIGGSGEDELSGMDFVISFALSTY